MLLRSRWFNLILFIAFSWLIPVGIAEEKVVDEAAKEEAPLKAKDLRHWAYQSIERKVIPVVKQIDWPRSSIDFFILKELEDQKLSPAPKAPRGTLIRRLYLDLTGLPPEPERVQRFMSDEDPLAYERLVDELLASSAYADRWAQTWLDLARFAETDGFEHDNRRPNAWKYRDWVIRAIEEDMPYDQFIRLQIAGDLFPNPENDYQNTLATGFALAGPDMPDINLKTERRHMILNELTSTVGSVFLGLQLGCAQCHDHKYDPLSQADFYRLRSFFDGVEIFKDHAVATPEDHVVLQRELKKWNSELQSLERELKDLKDQLKKRGKFNSPSKEKQSRFDRLNKLFSLKKRKRPSLPLGRVLKEKQGKVGASYLMVRGDFSRKGPEVKPNFPRALHSSMISVPQGKDSRRAWLANWLTRKENPLVTRVIVNRIWKQHFGKGLVQTPSDFGKMGGTPSHPDLLDWLASELPKMGWSLKRLHRLIVTSSVYQQDSRHRDSGSKKESTWKAKLAKDPENRWLSRYPRRRLEAEAIRDSLLSVSGQLNHRRGGPGVMPPLPEEIRKSIRRDHWKVDADPSQHKRKSIFLFVRRNLRYPFLEVFDRPDSQESCAQRSQSTNAPQSLALLNSEISLEAAQALSGELLEALREGKSERDLIGDLIFRVLSRKVNRYERELFLEFLNKTEALLKNQAKESQALTLPLPRPESLSPERSGAWVLLSLSVLNLNEFIYFD